jgi:hypothetical protein
MYWQSSGLKASLLYQMRGFLSWGQKENPKMAEQESPARRNANRHFRKEEQAKAGVTAWKEYRDQEDATRLKTAKLRAERLTRDAAAPATQVPSPKQARRTRVAKS